MGLMLHREPNQVRWVGARPGHNGTQVAVSGSATNATAVVYTVTTGKTLHLTDWVFGTSGNLRQIAKFFVTDVADVIQYTIATETPVVGGELPPVAASYTFPLEIPTGWKIKITSPVAAFIVYLFIHGWEE